MQFFIISLLICLCVIIQWNGNLCMYVFYMPRNFQYHNKFIASAFTSNYIQLCVVHIGATLIRTYLSESEMKHTQTHDNMCSAPFKRSILKLAKEDVLRELIMDMCFPLHTHERANLLLTSTPHRHTYHNLWVISTHHSMQYIQCTCRHLSTAYWINITPKFEVGDIHNGIAMWNAEGGGDRIDKCKKPWPFSLVGNPMSLFLFSFFVNSFVQQNESSSYSHWIQASALSMFKSEKKFPFVDRCA